ncbi:MAG: DUF2200 family protein [Bacteroidales bacterium]|nr:DUF2200 family protein [Bacteroidales bacterium]MDT8430719.1 DUF2200 family protein [Bacteroidales bacterium]
MTTTLEHDKRIANMTFSAVYPHYIAKVEKKQPLLNFSLSN